MSKGPPAEARQHPRARARLKVEYNYATTTSVGFTRDISEGGIFLVGTHLARPGTRIYLRVHLPSAAEPLKVIGVVTRSFLAAVTAQPGAPSGQGMGIQFEVAYAQTRDVLADFVKNLLQLSVEHAGPIEAVSGSTEGRSEYAVHFKARPRERVGSTEARRPSTPPRRPSTPPRRPSTPPRRQRPSRRPPQNVDEVREAFAFRVGVDWGRAASVAWKVVAVVAALALLIYVLVIIGGFISKGAQ